MLQAEIHFPRYHRNSTCGPITGYKLHSHFFIGIKERCAVTNYQTEKTRSMLGGEEKVWKTDQIFFQTRKHWYHSNPPFSIFRRSSLCGPAQLCTAFLEKSSPLAPLSSEHMHLAPYLFLWLVISPAWPWYINTASVTVLLYQQCKSQHRNRLRSICCTARDFTFSIL